MAPEHLKEFREQLAWDNLERTKIIAYLGGFFTVLLVFLDLYRYTSGLFEQDKIYNLAAIGHLLLSLTFVPAGMYFANRNSIQERTYPNKSTITALTIIFVGIALIWMALVGNYLRQSVTTFAIFILIANLIYTLPIRSSIWLNLISLLILICGILILQWNNLETLVINIVEALGFTIPTFFIANYQFRLKAEKFINEKKIQEQQAIIENSLVDEFNKKIAEIEMTALRAQMNPHFLFNCLNSIKLYMVQNDGVTAANYLTKFSRLIRLILNNSQSKLVRLSKELEALELYIEMEQFRYNKKFDYKIEVQEGIKTEMVDIPPMILQPYVENAIWHGLMHKEKGTGLLSINVQNLGEKIKFTVEDNGIGRAKAAVIKSRSATKHKSFGMQITKDRIEMTNQLYETQATVEITDLLDHQKKPMGTRVVIHLPIAGLN